jgi:Rrf2 family cysteine metabolism transcriptional repressor
MSIYLPWEGSYGSERCQVRTGGVSMWVSRRTDYATRAILVLSLESGGPMKLDELARRTAVPLSVLEQVMPTMRTAGIVRSERGPAGGYRLNKIPEEITLERIVRLFQGPLAPISCATRHNPEPCPMTVGCTLRDVWEEVRDATISLLGGVTFADLAARASGPWVDQAQLPTAPLVAES